MGSLQDMCVVVTGAGKGIGAAISKGLARQGACVVAASATLENARSVADAITGDGGRAVAVAMDVRDREAVKRTVDAAMSAFGRLDGIVNNAGVATVRPFLEITEEDWREVSDINTLGVLICMQEAIKAMLAQGRGGRVVNISSLAGRQGYEPLAHYSASKFGVIGLTQAAARAFAGQGILVNAVCPGVIATDMWRRVDEGFRENGLTSVENEAFEAFAATALLARPAVPDEIVGAVRFLLSSEAGFMTGQSLVVDGGIFLQ